MGDFVGAEIRNGFFQRRIVIQRGDLFGVMSVNHVLHRRRARHGGFFPQHGAGRAKGETGHVPQGRQCGGADTAFIDQCVEGVQVLLLLLGHMGNHFDRRACAGAGPHHRKLAFIDAHGTIFAGVIDPDNRRHIRTGLRGRDVMLRSRCLRSLPP